MRKKIILYISAIVVSAILLICGLIVSFLVRSDVHRLIALADMERMQPVPPCLAEFYLMNFRGNEKDIEYLKANQGLGYILAGNNEHKITDKTIKRLEFFLNKGFDINAVCNGYTALHHAIIYNQPRAVEYLLSKGADPNIRVSESRTYGKPEKTKLYGMTALELSLYLQEHGVAGGDRSAIIKILSKHSKKQTK